MPRQEKPEPPTDALDWTATEWAEWAREFGVDPEVVTAQTEMLELVASQTKDAKPR